MATVTATIRDFSVLDNVPLVAGVSAGRRVLLRFVFDNGSTQVAGGTDTLEVVVNTAAEARMRAGLTLTPRSWQLVQPAQSSATEYAATIATNGSGSSLALRLTPVTPSDWSTNATIAASAAVVPYVMHVLCDVA